MLNFLTKNKKGFTLIELVVVLLLLSFGVLALANMFKVTYRAFQKSEERYIKQEAVKEVAKLLQSGANSVAAAQSADIFDDLSVIPSGDAVNKTYSYLFAKLYTNPETNEVEGYRLYTLDRAQPISQARLLCDVPMYATIKAYKDDTEYYSGVTIELSALEDSFKYQTEDESGELVLNKPISDDKYYSLDVAYHFPNMVTDDFGPTVNHSADGTLSNADAYKQVEDTATGGLEDPVVKIPATDEGIVLRVSVDGIITNDPTSSVIGVPSMCFIATASYGLDSGEVGLLCKFRDECLLTNPLGTAFVNAYYKLSPPIAEFISDSEPLKAAVRVALKPLVGIATNALDEDAAKENAPWLAMFVLCGVGVTATLIRVKKRNKKVEE